LEFNETLGIFCASIRLSDASRVRTVARDWSTATRAGNDRPLVMLRSAASFERSAFSTTLTRSTNDGDGGRFSSSRALAN
jgi:hypothetical protein